MLEYSEFQKGREITINFDRICADSSNTRKEQKEEKKGMSIIARVSEKDKERFRNDVIPKINDLNYEFFVPNNLDNLHVTFLSIYPSKNIYKENSNPYFNDLIIKTLKEFFNEKRKNISLTLRFNEVRPGTWHGFNNNQIPNASNGTVVSMGDPHESENNKFVNLANELVCHLKSKLGQIFNDKFDRKFPTVWSTLGYFDHIDFYITTKFADTFKQFKEQYSKDPLEIKINTLKLVEYSYKDLRDNTTLLEFNL